MLLAFLLDVGYMFFIYTTIFYLLLPFIFLRLLWRSRKNPAYRKRWNERLALIPLQNNVSAIWVHAVSVGEVIAAIPLVKELASTYHDHRIVMTTTTPTGMVQINRSLNNIVSSFYLPYDVPWCINRFIRVCNIKSCVILETELWPNLLRCLSRNSVPVALVNARLSPGSKSNYGYIKWFIKKCLNKIDVVIAQDKADALRFQDLGLDDFRLKVGGNVKFDIKVDDDCLQKGLALREKLGFASRPTIVLSSTHDGEESIWLSVYHKIKQEIPNVLLVVVPRHIERFDLVARMFEKNNLTVARYSKNDAVNDDVDIYLVDAIGELMKFYAAAHVCFVGGSLVPIGGHNLIEPAVLGVPIVTGSYLHNFSYVKTLLASVDALYIRDDVDEISSVIVTLLNDKPLRDAIGKRAKDAIGENHGALDKHMMIIDAFNII